MDKLFIALLMLCCSLSSPAQVSAKSPDAPTRPFGLSAGMTRDEVVQKVGKNAIVENLAGSLVFNTVPLKSAYFDTYMCSFDQNDRLRSIVATSKPLHTQDGEDLRDAFESLKSTLENKYGKLLFVTGGRGSSIKWADRVGTGQPFMQALWDDSYFNAPSHIKMIVLSVTAGDKDHGLIKLEYDFKDDYVY